MKKIIGVAADKLGLALSSVYHLIDTEVIVLGGSVTKDYSDFEADLDKALRKYTQKEKKRSFNIKNNGNRKQKIYQITNQHFNRCSFIRPT